MNASAVKKNGEGTDVVSTEHDVDPGCTLSNGGAILLGQAPADGNLQIGVGIFRRAELAEVTVEPVVGVFAHGARVEDDDIDVAVQRVGAVGGRRIACLL